MKDKYSTDTAGVIDYTSDSYGVAYLHENETVRLGDTTGWYAGVIQNSFKFKDIGGSKENSLLVKGGVFKSIPFDYNNSLNWTILLSYSNWGISLNGYQSNYQEEKNSVWHWDEPCCIHQSYCCWMNLCLLWMRPIKLKSFLFFNASNKILKFRCSMSVMITLK